MSADVDKDPPWPPHVMDAWVPHRGAMNLLDTVAHRDDLGIEARVRVPAEGLFMDAAGMPAWVGIEYMAQAVAAGASTPRPAEDGDFGRIGYFADPDGFLWEVAWTPRWPELSA